jgi:anti-sigma regulatory factor (Ser/Thr protein kinase)
MNGGAEKRVKVSLGTSVRAAPGESVAGDECGIVHFGKGVVAALADGLGHGPAAAHAAKAFLACVRAAPDRPLEEILGNAHRALVKTRGAVVALARFDEVEERVEFAAVGNVTTIFFRRKSDRRIHPLVAAGVLGAVYRSVRVETFPFGTGDGMVMHSDGVQTRLEMGDMTDGDPADVAAAILRDRAKPSDDASCLVARAAPPAEARGARPVDAGACELRVHTRGDAECAAHMTRAFAMRLRLPARAQWEASIAASELATNALKFAGEGVLALRHVHEPREALVIEMTDRGDGMADVTAALVDGFSEGALRSPDSPRFGRSLGVGLGSVHRLMDDVVVDSAPRQGTRVTARKFVRR